MNADGQSLNEKSSLQNSSYNKSLPLILISHGFYNDIKTKWLYLFKDALLKKIDANIVLVGYGEGAKFPFYFNASSNIRVVGKEISLLIKNIKTTFYPSATTTTKTNSINQFKIHCIGHSLGL
jgi:hypothetical protein